MRLRVGENAVAVLWMLMAVSVGRGQQPDAAKPSADEPVEPIERPALVPGLRPPKLIHHAEATYSDEARWKHINGQCDVGLVVDAQGNPKDLKIIRCSDTSFIDSSLAAVRDYKFEPAKTKEGKAVSVRMTVAIDYHMSGALAAVYPVRFDFFTPPGVTATAPDAKGVYPLTKEVTPPGMKKFVDEGWNDRAFGSRKSLCKIVLTIDAKGNASDGFVAFCASDALEPLALKSLLASHHKPATLNGKPVSVRAMVQLDYGNHPATP